MQRIPKQSNYVKNKPSELPVYLDDAPLEEIDAPSVEPILHEELKPMNIAMDDYADDFGFQDFDNSQDQEFTGFQYHEIQYYDENPEEVNPEELEPEEVDPEDVDQEEEAAPVEKKARMKPRVKTDYKGLDAAERERLKREKGAARARARYQAMTDEQRKEHNYKRRIRQLGIIPDMADAEDVARAYKRMSEVNARKAEQQRERYHQLTDEQKRQHNRKRTEALRRRRQQENQVLFSNNPGEATAEQLEMAQQIVEKSAKKAERARLRYQRMTDEERKELNRKKWAAARRRRGIVDDMGGSSFQAYPQGPSGFNIGSLADLHNDQSFEQNSQGTSQDTGDDYGEQDE